MQTGQVVVLRALPAVGFISTFGWFFVDKNREARTVLGSPRGLLAVAVVVAGYVVIAILVRRFARWSWTAPVVLTGVVLGLAAWIVRPYYVDETVERRLVSGAVAAPSTTTSVDTSTTIPAAAGTTSSSVADTTSVPTATRISTGRLKGLGHDARGTVSIIRGTDGALVVRFEDFDIEGVPDPRVHLVPTPDAERPGGVDLGRLPGNRGRVLDFAVPAGMGTDAAPGWTVLVWCRAFSVPVANATQQG